MVGMRHLLGLDLGFGEKTRECDDGLAHGAIPDQRNVLALHQVVETIRLDECSAPFVPPPPLGLVPEKGDAYFLDWRVVHPELVHHS